ncbi:MAG TPA: hypothetical protein VGQ68_03475 [Gaiellaceae bacterium]|jgi:hypothetical protein|nr:hypothetical protein [Gaiellaceae bacterium]
METFLIAAAVAALVLAPIVAGLTWLATRRPLALSIFAIVALLDALWLTDLVLIARDYRDTDGFIDCWPSCTVEQEIAGGVLFYTPLLMALILAGSLAVLARTRWQARRPPTT